MRLRPQSELGWHMLQWLAVLVLGHQAQANPELLRGVARTLATRKAPEPVMALVECGCCLREVAKLDGIYETCEACAECLSLGQCYDLAEGDLGHNVNCCHGANHGAPGPGMVITGIDQEKGIITVEASRPNAFVDEVGHMTPALLEALARTGQMVIDTQPPPPGPLTAADLVELYPKPA